MALGVAWGVRGGLLGRRAESLLGVSLLTTSTGAFFSFFPDPACSKNARLASIDPTPTRFVFNKGSCCLVGSGRAGIGATGPAVEGGADEVG